MVIPCMEEFLNASDSQHLQSCQNVLSRVDDNFSQLYQEIHQIGSIMKIYLEIESTRVVFARFKDKQYILYRIFNM